MKILLLALAVLLLAGAVYLRKLVEGYRKPGRGTVRLVIMMKDQEPWAEGFIRKLFRFTRNTPSLEIQVFDDGSNDLTWEVLERLQRVYPFSLTRELDGWAGGRSPAGGYFFDLRGLYGSDLLNAPVFSQLNTICAGEFPVLSK